jgi:hypothetical protein
VADNLGRRSHHDEHLGFAPQHGRTSDGGVKRTGGQRLRHTGCYFDGAAGRSFLLLNGTFQLSFKAKGTGGSNAIALNLSRLGLATYLNQTVNLTNSWATYTFNFSAAESGSNLSNVAVKFSTVGQDSFLMDDVSLTQTNSDPTNPTAFRDPVVNALKTFNPGVLRFWALQLGDTLDNLIAPEYGRQRSGYLAWYTEQDDISYGLPEFLQLCQTIGAEPWIVVPSTFSATEAANLIEYLAGTASTPYGSKRVAAGYPSPWTSLFTKIHMEFGNEAWNSAFKGGSIEYSAPYGQRAQAIFGAMRGNGSYNPSAFDLVLGGQATWPGRNQDIQNNCNNNDSFALAPYMMNTVNSFATNEDLFGSTFAEPEAFVVPSGVAEGLSGGLLPLNQQALAASSHPVPLSIYEANLSTISGAITQTALNSYASSLGAGLAVADSMLQQMRQGVLTQNLFALPQYEYNRPDGSTVFLWGSVIDMGVTDRRRPQFLALQLANQAIGNNAAMVRTVHSGANPTWDQPLVNSVQLTGAHYLQSFAFSSGSTLSVIVFNLHRSSSLAVTFSGPNAPSGTVQMQRLTSAQLTDGNEVSPLVNITSQALAAFNPSSGISLPPYSMTVLSWTAGTNPLPVISSVTSTAITGTSATITWTTDQASSSQVKYGTTTSYGSLSAITNTLVTSHSVNLAGLAPGTTYDYAVMSADAAGNATSANFTFSTSASSGPVISAVASSGITSTSAIITWTTDQPSSSQIEYGTTTGYGTLSQSNPVLATSHSVTLTGLIPGTTYDFAALSANAGGTLATSANFTLATQSGPPVLKNVTVSGITATSATIAWTTDQPSTSQVQYGTTTSYGSLSTLDSSLVTSHAVTLSGLTAGTTYNFEAMSTNATGLSNASPNSAFTTASSGPAPVIQSLAFWGITGSGITISWSTDQSSNTAVEYGTTQALGQTSPIQPTLSAGHGVVLTGLSDGTTYYFRARSTNASNVSGYSMIYSFKTLDVTAPVISNIQLVSSSNHAAVVAWSVSKAATSQVEFGTTTYYGLWSNPSASFPNQQATLWWVPSGTIHYRIHSTDASGNQAVSPDYTFVEP